jgi:hypothetical protein
MTVCTFSETTNKDTILYHLSFSLQRLKIYYALLTLEENYDRPA